MKSFLLVAAASAALLSAPAAAQSGGVQPNSNERLQQILGNIFGQSATASNSL